jgi:hypothetical protein
MSDVYIGLPRKIRVGQYTFRVTVGSEEKYPVLEGNDGVTDFGQFRIYLGDKLHRQRAINVVQHELTHAINWVYGVTDGSEEEHITTQHTNGLIELWVSNPKVFGWFAKSLRTLKRENAQEETE